MKKAVVLIFLSIGFVLFFSGISWCRQSAYDRYQSFQHSTKEDMFKKALELERQQKPAEALKIIKKLYDNEIKPFAMALHLASLYINLGQYNEALKIYEKFKRQHRLTLRQLGKPSRKNVTYSHFYFNLGTIYLKLKRYGDGIEALKKVLKSHNYRTPNRHSKNRDIFSKQTPRQFYSMVHYQLGLAYLKMGDKKNAVKQYERLKDLDEKKGEQLRQRLSKNSTQARKKYP